MSQPVQQSAQQDESCHVIVSGKVQGVNYRYTLRERAMELGVRGWCRNLPDGRVEAVFLGKSDKIQRLLSWCARGPLHAKVEDVIVESIPAHAKHTTQIAAEFEVLI